MAGPERRSRRAQRGSPALVPRAVRTSLRALGLEGRSVVVAVSGGVDSVVLAHALAGLARTCRLRVAVAHVHHGLRGAEADADQRFVEALAAKLGLPCLVARVDPRAARRGGTSRTRPTLQEAARALRYEALQRLADQASADVIATAHHADDQAETVLLRLFRGCGPDGLGGIAERSHDGRVVRPLLAVSRAEIERHARAHGLEWREDPSNRCADYARSRLRTRWIPGLADDFNPRLLQRIADLAEAQRRESEWIAAEVQRRVRSLRREVESAPARGRATWSREGWAELPDALARRVVRALFIEAGLARDVSRRHLDRVVAFLRAGRTGTVIELPGSVQMRCQRDGFRLQRCGVRGDPAC